MLNRFNRCSKKAALISIASAFEDFCVPYSLAKLSKEIGCSYRKVKTYMDKIGVRMGSYDYINCYIRYLSVKFGLTEEEVIKTKKIVRDILSKRSSDPATIVATAVFRAGNVSKEEVCRVACVCGVLKSEHLKKAKNF